MHWQKKPLKGGSRPLCFSGWSPASTGSRHTMPLMGGKAAGGGGGVEGPGGNPPQHSPGFPFAFRTNSRVLAEASKASGHAPPAPSPVHKEELLHPDSFCDLSPAGCRDQDRLPGRAPEPNFGTHKHGDSDPPRLPGPGAVTRDYGTRGLEPPPRLWAGPGTACHLATFWVGWGSPLCPPPAVGQVDAPVVTFWSLELGGYINSWPRPTIHPPPTGCWGPAGCVSGPVSPGT